MANNISVKDAAGTTKQIHTIEDSTSAHFNMSIPINTSGVPIFTTVAPGVVSLADSVIGVSISPTQANIPVVNAAGTNLIGAVSIRQVVSVVPDGTGANFPVSIAPPTFNIPVSIAGGSISVTGGTQTVSIGGATSLQAVQIAGRDINGDARIPRTHTDGSILVHVCNSQPAPSADVSISPSQASIPVSIAGGSFAIADNAPVSVHGGVLGAVSLGGGTANIGSVVNAAGTNLIGAVSIRQIVSVVWDGTNANAPVSIAGTPTFNLGTITGNIGVSIAGQTGNVAVSIAPPTFNVPVSIAGTPTVNLGTITGNIGVSIAGQTGNIGVSVIQPSYNMPVSLHPVTINAGTALIGAVSIRQIVSVVWDGTNANAPVSIAGTPTFNLGTITGNIGVSIAGQTGNIGVSVINPTFNLPVSIAGTPTVNLGTITGNIGVSIAGMTGNIGVSIAAVNGNIGVSIGGTNNIGVSVKAGAVSVAGMVTVEPKSNTGAAVPAGAFFIGGTDGTNLRGMLVDALGAQLVGGAVTNAEASFTRPADTTAYTAGDMVANDTNKNSLTPLSFALSKFSTGGGSVTIRRARVVKSTGSLTNAQFRLHLYATSNGVTNDGVSAATSADNASYQATKVSTYLGYMSVTMAVSHNDGAVGWGGPNEGMEMNVVLPAARFGIQGLLEARAAYTPGNAERFNVTLEAFQN